MASPYRVLRKGFCPWGQTQTTKNQPKQNQNAPKQWYTKAAFKKKQFQTKSKEDLNKFGAIFTVVVTFNCIIKLTFFAKPF